MYCVGNSQDFRAMRAPGLINCDNEEMATNIVSSKGTTAHMTEEESASLSTLTIAQRGGNVTKKSQTLQRGKKASIPFASFTVLEFVRYSRALKDEKQLTRMQVLERVRAAGLAKSLNCRLKRLSVVEYRALNMAIKTEEDTQAAYVNFEGLKYSRKNKKTLNRFVNTWAARLKVFVLVDDNRFIPKKVKNLG